MWRIVAYAISTIATVPDKVVEVILTLGDGRVGRLGSNPPDSLTSTHVDSTLDGAFMVAPVESPPRKMRTQESVIVPLRVYQELVDRCARDRLDLPIANGSAFHARILIAKLFEIAKEEVQIVSGKLTDTSAKGVDVYGHQPVIDQAKRFLSSPGTVLSIVLQDGRIDQGNDNRFLKQLMTDPARNGTIQVYAPPADIVDSATPHFMVADGGAYRLETAKDADPKEEAIKAIANFGDLLSGRELAALFTDVQSILEEEEPGVVPTFVIAPGQAVDLTINHR